MPTLKLLKTDETQLKAVLNRTWARWLKQQGCCSETDASGSSNGFEVNGFKEAKKLVKKFCKGVTMKELQEAHQVQKRKRDEQKLEKEEKIRARAAGVERKGKPVAGM